MSESPRPPAWRGLPHREIRRLLGVLGLAAIALTVLGLAVVLIRLPMWLLPLLWGLL